MSVGKIEDRQIEPSAIKTVIQVFIVPAFGQRDQAAPTILKRLCARDQQAGPIALTVVTDLEEALRGNVKAPVIVLSLPAETAIATTIARGHAPSVAVAAWRQTTLAQLPLLRGHRSRITLLEGCVLDDGAEVLLGRLARRLDLGVLPADESLAGHAFGPKSVDCEEASEVPPMATALARIALAESLETEALVAELDALTFGSQDQSADCNVRLADAAFVAQNALALRADTEQKAVQAALSRAEARAIQATDNLEVLTRERSLLLDQLDQMQHVVTQLQEDSIRFTAVLLDTRVQAAIEQETLHASLTQAEARAIHATANLEILARERTLLIDQLDQMQQVVTQSQQEATGVTAILLETNVQAATEQKALHAALTQAEARALQVTADLEVLARERALLLDQLDQIQQVVKQAQEETASIARVLNDKQGQAIGGVAEGRADHIMRESVLGSEILRLSRELSARKTALETLQASAALQMHERDTNLVISQSALADREQQLAIIRQTLAEKEHALETTEQRLHAVYASRSWRITGPLRRARLAMMKKGRSA